MSKSAPTKKEFFAALDYYDVNTIKLQGRGCADFLTEECNNPDLVMNTALTNFMVYGKSSHNLSGVVMAANTIRVKLNGFEARTMREKVGECWHPRTRVQWEERVSMEFAKYKCWIDEYRSIRLSKDGSNNV
jgi:hypothetical protein